MGAYEARDSGVQERSGLVSGVVRGGSGLQLRTGGGGGAAGGAVGAVAADMRGGSEAGLSSPDDGRGGGHLGFALSGLSGFHRVPSLGMTGCEREGSRESVGQSGVSRALKRGGDAVPRCNPVS
jgi:hypothetical protein